MWCDAAVTKKAKTESEIEEDWTAKDMETNYVLVSKLSCYVP